MYFFRNAVLPWPEVLVARRSVRLPPDPLETLKGPGRRTYCARGAMSHMYTACRVPNT